MRAAIHLGILGWVVVAVASARAETPGARPLIASERTRDGVRFVRQVLPATGASALAESRIIYLNRDGVALRPGGNDSRTNRSSLVAEPVTVPRWDASAKLWNATVACVRGMFAPFDVVVTDEDPGDAAHVEAVFAESPRQIGLSEGIGGVSPFTTDCSVIEHSIVFTFAGQFPQDPQVLCEVMTQEIAHSYGLDHELLASDPMTYLDYRGKRAFQDQTMPCGEHAARPCGIAGVECRPTQNSVQLLRERLGISAGVPPVEEDEPDDAASVVPGCDAGAGAGLLVALMVPFARRRRARLGVT